MFKALFQPIQIGSMTVKNRLVMPAMGTNLGEPGGLASDALIEYYTQRARGGMGLIITECTAVTPDGMSLKYEGGMWNDEQVESFKRLTSSIHEAGGKIVMQLVHHGRQGSQAYNGGKQIGGPSSVPCPLMQEVPHAFTTEEVYEQIDIYVNACVNVQKAGFDGVELHVASGYLIEQFLSPHSNKRTDEFGGTLHNRMRFLLSIIKGIRRNCGNDFPIIIRLAVEELMTGGLGLAETKAIVRASVDAGIDAVDVTIGTYGSIQNIIACSHYQPGYMWDYPREIKKMAGVPVIGVGRLQDPYVANEAVVSGYMDMVAIGRQSMADPQYANKVLAGDLEDICPCISCNQGCIHQLFADTHVSCVSNPFNGFETEKIIKEAETKKNVAVIGGGPGGLEAAWILAKRGHKVKLYEKEDHLGGAFLVAAYPPGKTDITKMIAYYEHQCKKYGVKVFLNTEVNARLLEQDKPDAIVLATGSSPLKPHIEGIDNENILLANDVLTGKAVTGHKVLIAGGGLIGSETAEFLEEQTRETAIIEMKPMIAGDLPAHNRPVMMEALHRYGVDMYTDAKILKFTEDGVVYEKNGETCELTGFDSIVLAMGTVAYNPLEEAASKVCKEVYSIGDASEAGNVFAATHDAMNVALTI